MAPTKRERRFRFLSPLIGMGIALVGGLGLLNLPNQWLIIFMYSVTLFYAVTWTLGIDIRSHNNWIDRMLLLLGGYVAGTSLTGAPLMVAVYMRHVAIRQLRNTLFVLWFILVSIKMSTFALLSVDLQLDSALLLIPVAAIGHVLGLKAHDHDAEHATCHGIWIKRLCENGGDCPGHPVGIQQNDG